LHIARISRKRAGEEQLRAWMIGRFSGEVLFGSVTLFAKSLFYAIDGTIREICKVEFCTISFIN